MKIAYGSQVYGVAHAGSDRDFYEINDQTAAQYGIDLADHKVVEIEVFYRARAGGSYHPVFDSFELDLKKVRHSFSKTSSNSWVKCKKKLEVEHEYYIGKKSLWHSFRILMFGKQLANYGKIVNWSEANPLYDGIVNCPRNDWVYYKETYQKAYNRLNSEFRAICPK